MSIKVKILRENKKQKLDESLVDILSDPATMISLAAALGVSVVALKGLLSGDSGDASEDALRNARAGIEKRIAQASIGRPPDPPTDDGAELAASPRKRAELELKRLKMRRAAEEEQFSLLPED